MVVRGDPLARQFGGGFGRRLKGKGDVPVAKVGSAAALSDISVEQLFGVLALKWSPARDEMFFAKTLVSHSYPTFSM